MPLEIFTIDFWNTLFDSSGGEMRNLARRSALLGAIRAAGNECDEARFEAVYGAIWDYFDDHWLNRQRTPTAPEMIGEMLRQLGFTLDRDVLDRVTSVFSRGVLEHPPRVLPGVVDALGWLTSRGIRLALISDTGFSPGLVLRELMHNAGIASYFSNFVFSDETGVSKPHPEAFRAALAPFGTDPSRACHVGDIERTDIQGAKNAGMKALLFRGADRHKHTELETDADLIMEDWGQIRDIVEQLERISR